MSKQNSPVNCNQRYKGVENFLRRIAFNLGNTPSQTEVKIISCIPIDVTDLQQRIVDLEKQLKETTESKGSTNRENNTSCAPALCTTYPRLSETAAACNDLDCDRCTSPCHDSVASNQSSNIKSTNSYLPGDNRYCNSNTSNVKPSCNPSQPLVICEPQKEERRNFFRKKCPKKKVRTHIVCYAQTNSTPFNDIDKENGLDDMKAKMNDSVTRAYLANVVSRQYRPKVLGRHISEVSDYSSPVCRDSPPGCSRPYPYESDVCSCCHGPFQNIDKYSFNQSFNSVGPYANDISPRNAYYDSSLYDLIPVKEKPVKVKRDMDVPIMKEPKAQMDMCFRTKPRYRPFIVNYHTINPARNIHTRNSPKYLKKRDSVAVKMSTKLKRAQNFSQQIDISSSRSCCVEYGNVYAKLPRYEQNILPAIRITPPLLKNAECLTTVVNNTECQTITSNSEVKKSEGKTEATLNQIKSILQSVLTEVKTNSQLKNTSEYKPKRDAVVQKGASQCILQGSTFLNSFTYSPYDMNPYIAGSQQMNPSQFYNPQSTMKCLQNFPLIIQSGRYMCNSCYKNTSNIKSMCTKQATTTSTNTDERKEERHKETEKLIKEIYKSIALNLPNKDASLSDYEYLKSMHEFEQEVTKKPQVEKNETVVRAISEVLIKKIAPAVASGRNTSSKVTSNTIASSTQSESITTDTERTHEKVARLLQNRNNSVSVSTAVESLTPLEELDVISASESESSSSDAESDATYIPKEPPKPNQKKGKESLLSKMFKSVFKTKEKSKKSVTKLEVEAESGSDSDDYQTIYSRKVDTPKYRTRAVNLPKLKTHSKISNSKQMYRERSPQRFKRSPYMEQEYRRHWNERLMFDNKELKYSSERPASTRPRRAPYYQHHEARTALVEPREHQRRESEQPEYFQRGTQNAAENFNKYRATGAKGMAWLKKHKMGVHCGEQWKRLILES